MTPQLAYDKIKEALELAKEHFPSRIDYCVEKFGVQQLILSALAFLPELMPVKVGENACPDCGAEMIEVCSGLEKEVRGKRAGECLHKEMSPAAPPAQEDEHVAEHVRWVQAHYGKESVDQVAAIYVSGKAAREQVPPRQSEWVKIITQALYWFDHPYGMKGVPIEYVDKAKRVIVELERYGVMDPMNRTVPTCEEIIALLEPIAEQDWHGKWRIRKAVEIMRSVKPAPTCEEIWKEINKFKYKNVTGDATVSFNLAIDLCEDGICNLFERAGK